MWTSGSFSRVNCAGLRAYTERRIHTQGYESTLLRPPNEADPTFRGWYFDFRPPTLPKKEIYFEESQFFETCEGFWHFVFAGVGPCILLYMVCERQMYGVGKYDKGRSKGFFAALLPRPSRNGYVTLLFLGGGYFHSQPPHFKRYFCSKIRLFKTSDVSLLIPFSLVKYFATHSLNVFTTTFFGWEGG